PHRQLVRHRRVRAAVVATSVRIAGLTRSYGGDAVVRGLDLDVAPGTLTALLGPSGCGKTTTLKVVAGLLTADAGDVLFDGASVLHLPPEKRPVAMVFQKALLFPHLTVGENVGFGLRMRKVPKRQAREQVARMLDLVRLGDLADRRVGEVSGGQEQRVALARALVTEPQVLLLDEPFSQLDAALRVEVRDLVRELQQQLGVTTLFVTHDQEEAVSLADDVALVLDGRVEQSGPPRAFYETPASLRVSRFFGGRNEVPGVVRDGRFTCPLGDLTTSLPAGPAVAVVRPESLVVGGPGTPATLRSARYLGTHTALELVLDDGTVLRAHTGPLDVAVGERTTVGAPPGACTVLPPGDPS
ncbi:MAG: transporter related protein, partial [Frankiales bacterium]|nr:transporter related protein [Frankiales bacterium]